MKKAKPLTALTLVGALALLSACSGGPVGGTGVRETAIRILNVPSEVRLVTLEVDGVPHPVRREGEAWVARLSLASGERPFLARGWDREDPREGVVLYRARERRNVTPGEEVRLTLHRLTADVEVRVTNPLPGEAYVARAGGSEAALPGSQGFLRGVPTGRGIPLLVEALDSSGRVLRQGSATLTLSEGDGSVQVNLASLGQNPPGVSLSGPDTAHRGQAYTLTVVARDPNPGVSLTRLLLDWGDGNQETIPLSGREATLTRSHVYTASGSFTVTAQVESSTGFRAQASKTLRVLDGDTTVIIAPGPGLTRVVLELTGTPEGTVLAEAEIVPEDPSFSRHLLTLYPGGGAWRGALSLPTGLIPFYANAFVLGHQ